MIGKKLLRSLLGAALMASAALAHSDAGEQVTGLLKGVRSLNVYEHANDDKVKAQLPPQDVSFPLDVREVDGDFLKVKLGNQDVWIDGADVVLSKNVAYGCVKQQNKPSKVASTQGASGGCQ